MQLPVRHSSSGHYGLFLRVQDAKCLNCWQILRERSTKDSVESVVWVEETCTHVVSKIIVRPVMILHNIQITCGSLEKVSRIDLEGTTSIAQSKSELWRTKKR